MHLTISYVDGRRIDAILLAASPERMRISIPDGDDAVELRMEDGVWIAETGELVEIESMILDSRCSDIRPVARSAASGGVS